MGRSLMPLVVRRDQTRWVTSSTHTSRLELLGSAIWAATRRPSGEKRGFANRFGSGVSGVACPERDTSISRRGTPPLAGG